MALYNLEITPCDCGENCRPQNITVDADINDLIVGNTYSFSGTNCNTVKCIKFGCYVIEKISLSMFQANTIIVNSYGPSEPNGCDDCIDDIANYLEFRSCFNLDQRLYIPIGQIIPTPITPTTTPTATPTPTPTATTPTPTPTPTATTPTPTPTPTEGVVYYLEYAISQFGQTYQAFGCFQFMGRIYIQPGGLQTPDVLVLTATTQTDCQTCLENSAILYEGLDCLTNNKFIIALPSEGLENHLISYTDLAGLTQYCGVIKRTVQDSGLPDALLVSDLGLLNEETNNCEDCLAQANEKKELINCLDLTTEVVWASVLFDTGNSTHLSQGEGCYEVGEIVPPETPITISELANYDPQENCEDCLECYGVIYEFTSCEEIEVCGPTNIMSNNNLYGGRDFVIDSSNNMFVPFRYSNRIGKYDLTTQTFVEQSNEVLNGPESVAIDEINGVICVANYGSNYVTFFDSAGISLGMSINITSLVYFPKKAYYEPIDGYFYVAFNYSSSAGPGIKVYSGSNYSTMSEIATFGNNFSYTDVVRVGSNMYVLNSTDSTMEVWSIVGLTYTQTNTINLGSIGDSLSYDSASNVIYIKVNSNYYLKYFISTSILGTVFYSFPCGSGKIMVNNSTNRLYITDSNCGLLYEFDSLTDTLLKTYNDLGNYGVVQVYGIGIDTSNNTWFSSYYNSFELGCALDFISGEVTSNEYLPIGSTFFNYTLSACCEITSIQSITEPGYLNTTEYLSMLHYEDCISCTGDSVEVFYCEDCTGDNSGILIAPSGQHSIGDFVRSQFGNSDFICYEIIDVYSDQGGDSFVSDGNSYTSCDECSSGATLGLNIVNCDTLESLQVNVSLSEWSEISGFPNSLPNSVISDSNGTCYQVVNACPIDNNNPPFEISDFYYNQSFCRFLSQETRSARTSGIEVEVCIVLCDESVLLVNPPHPVWTDNYGIEVTQLSAITLGGINGLNN